MTPALKKIFKPPFTNDGDRIIGKSGETLAFARCEYLSIMEDHDIAKIITQCLNKEWECESEEPLRWKYDNLDNGSAECPKCGRDFFTYGYPTEFPDYWDDFKYCPSCGVRLLAPEEVSNESDS